MYCREFFPPFKKVSLSIFAVIILSMTGCSQAEQGRVCLNDKCFNVEVVRHGKKRTQGLMFRDRLDYDKGMLFISEESKNYGFWMKNTYIPLDIIWINGEGEVVFIKENAQPCKSDSCSAFRPQEKTKYVLELNAGVVSDIKLKVGDRLDFYIK
jgi:uncharacterized membrane protein (UPF0127 family)